MPIILNSTPGRVTGIWGTALIRLRDGKLHPRFSAHGPSLKVRNGVGVRDGQTVVFAISNEAVSFGDFGRLYRDTLKCSNALFLDGSISSLYAPSAGRSDELWPAGPIVSVRAKGK